MDAEGVCWVLELDTGPGLTETSLLPVAALAGGVCFRELVLHLIERALARQPV